MTRGTELSHVPGVVGDDGAIRVETTGGQTLYVGIHEEGYTVVKRAAPGADGPVLNHFDAGAVRRDLSGPEPLRFDDEGRLVSPFEPRAST